MPHYLWPPFTAAGSGKEKDKQIPTKNVETVTVSEGVAQQQGVYTIVLRECMHVSHKTEQNKTTTTTTKKTTNKAYSCTYFVTIGTSGSDTLPEQTELVSTQSIWMQIWYKCKASFCVPQHKKIEFLEAEVEKLRKQLDHEKSKSSKYIYMLHRVAS